MALTSQIVVIALFGFAYVAAYQDVLKATLVDCKNGTAVTDEEVEEFAKPLIPKNEEERCLMACVFRAYNVIVDGKFDVKLAYAVSKNILHQEPEKLKHVKETLDYCGHEIPTSMDNDCDLAGKMMECRAKYNKDHGYDD
uniref:Odorant-binding protein 15 n=1 Tax=Cyrtorhinus lividipennis TaxID=1032904 RepID=A0A346THZ7_9HEMI|nr:odorant-binding protein 15 [Cyrtorhinus lividipennis]